MLRYTETTTVPSAYLQEALLQVCYLSLPILSRAQSISQVYLSHQYVRKVSEG